MRAGRGSPPCCDRRWLFATAVARRPLPALGARELGMRARRRREVVALEGSTALALDDLAEAVTYALRGAKRLTRRGGGLELARLRALRAARREMRS